MHRHPVHRWVRSAGLVVATVLGLSVLTAPVADAGGGHTKGAATFEVIDWNQYSYEAVIVDRSAGAVLVHLAMVHRAIRDALDAIDDRRSWHGGRHRPSAAAAVATAANEVLIGLVLDLEPPIPGVADSARPLLKTRYDAAIAAATESDGARAVEAGTAVGAAAAHRILEKRADDGRYADYQFPTGQGVGEWRFEPPATAPPEILRFDWLGGVRPFSVRSADQFRAAPPNPITSSAYTREYQEVMSYGRAEGSARTPYQQATADFFNVNSIELFNRTFRTIAREHKLSRPDQARLFDLLSTATADSLITCWADKARYLYWRPITAIRNGDADGNPNTVGDTGWTPMVGTPPYPDHTSGYNCISGAMMYTAKAFFGTDRFRFTLTKFDNTAKRKYHRFTDVVRDTIDVRVWQGLHFRAADVQAARTGERVAGWVARHRR